MGCVGKVYPWCSYLIRILMIYAFFRLFGPWLGLGGGLVGSAQVFGKCASFVSYSRGQKLIPRTSPIPQGLVVVLAVDSLHMIIDHSFSFS